MKVILRCILIVISCLFTGCKKNPLDKIIFKNHFQCNIDGRNCYSDEKNTYPYGNFKYSYDEETQNFNLIFYEYQIKERNSTDNYRLHLGLCTHSLPEIGKKYEMVDTDSLYRYVFVKNACWVSLTYITPFYNYMDTTLLPKEIRKDRSTVRSKKIKGYLVFDEMNLETSIFSGRFNFDFEGENACYPDTKVKFTVSNGEFKLYFWDQLNPSKGGTPYFTKVESLWDCYESEK